MGWSRSCQNDDELCCDPYNSDSVVSRLAEPKEVGCKSCMAGESRDNHGNCERCPFGTF
jgi:hypothetical protein